jgi:hypothetical protein
MRRINYFAALTALLTVIMAAETALAQNPHFVVGPTFTVTGDDQVQATGQIVDLGHENITVVLPTELKAGPSLAPVEGSGDHRLPNCIRPTPQPPASARPPLPAAIAAARPQR